MSDITNATVLRGPANPVVRTDGPIANIPVRADEFSQTYYAPAHLEKIREMYRAGAPITLPAQLEAERAELDAARNPASLSPADSVTSSVKSTPAGTAGSIPSSAT